MSAVVKRRARSPMSTHAILKAAGCTAASGVVGFRVRERFDADLDAALRSFHKSAVEMFGAEEAACVLAHLLAKAPPGTEGGFEPPEWAVRILRTHRNAVTQALATGG